MGSPSPLQLANAGLVQSPLGAGVLTPPQFDPSAQDLVVAQGTDDVAQCIMTIILTRKGEITGNEEFGTTIPDMLFEPVQGWLDAAPLEIQRAIALFEPRVASCTVEAKSLQDNTGPYVQITVTWWYKLVVGPARNGNLKMTKYLDSTGANQATGWKVV